MHCRRAVASLSTSFRQDFTSSWVDGEVDFLREALMVLVDEIMDAELSAQVGAEYGERTPDPVTHRNGYWWLTRSSWLTCPHRNLRKKVPRVDGSLTMQPRTPTVPPARSASAASMQSPPATAEATSVSRLSPMLARHGTLPRRM